jgi:hypothetical protein
VFARVCVELERAKGASGAVFPSTFTDSLSRTPIPDGGLMGAGIRFWVRQRRRGE